MIRIRLLILAIIASLLAPAATLVAQPRAEQPATVGQIKELLVLTGAAKNTQLVADTMIANFQRSAPAAPVEFWSELKAGLNTQELVDLLVPVYQRHLTSADAAALLAFWKTVPGKRYLEVQPLLLTESMQVGQQWGERKAQEIVAKLQQRGYLKK